jgi:mono/diheme cytochrome c family protein
MTLKSMGNIMEKWILVATLFVSVVVFAAGAPAADLAKAKEGAMIYDAYCASCHGVELNNTAPGVTFDLRRLRADERSRFDNSVLNGKNQMPPWRGVLAPEQIDALWSYIRATVDH